MTGAWAIVAPDSFFSVLAAFGTPNNHLLFDFGSFAIPLGLALLAAVRWESWRVPVLAIASGHWVLHTVSHFLDTNHHHGQAIGWLEAVGLLGSSVILLLALWLTGRPADHQHPG